MTEKAAKAKRILDFRALQARSGLTLPKDSALMLLLTITCGRRVDNCRPRPQIIKDFIDVTATEQMKTPVSGN